MNEQKKFSQAAVDDKILLAEYRKTGLLPRDIETLKHQADKMYTCVLTHRYWMASIKLHNANKLLHGDCSYCVHLDKLKQEKMPCTACYYLVGLDAQSDSWECVLDISEELNGMLEKHDADRRRATDQ